MKPAVALLAVAALLGGVCLAMPRLSRVTFVDEPTVRALLPTEAGAWRSQRIRFCQNPAHGEMILLDEAPGSARCPVCDGALEPLSLFERSVLPSDTRADKRQYQRGDDRLQVAIVFSGRDRSSIHRPEVCLVGDGSEIVSSRIRAIPLADRPPLKVALVDVQQSRRLPDGRLVTGRIFFAYWFTGRGHETASHPVRMFWMAWDRILRSRAYPWAYISVTGLYDREPEAALRKLDDLVQALYPLLRVDSVRPESPPAHLE